MRISVLRRGHGPRLTAAVARGPFARLRARLGRGPVPTVELTRPSTRPPRTLRDMPFQPLPSEEPERPDGAQPPPEPPAPPAPSPTPPAALAAVAADPPPPDEAAVGKQADLEAVLRALQTDVTDITGAVLASRDGLVVASTVAEPRTTKLAAMAAAVLALAEQAVDADVERPLDHALIRGTEGCFAVYGAGPVSALAVQTVANPNVGLVEVEVPRSAAIVAGLLGGRAVPDRGAA